MGTVHTMSGPRTQDLDPHCLSLNLGSALGQTIQSLCVPSGKMKRIIELSHGAVVKIQCAGSAGSRM